jgi:hypothetical protein
MIHTSNAQKYANRLDDLRKNLLCLDIDMKLPSQSIDPSDAAVMIRALVAERDELLITIKTAHKTAVRQKTIWAKKPETHYRRMKNELECYRRLVGSPTVDNNLQSSVIFLA